jgi:hypothetical protein
VLPFSLIPSCAGLRGRCSQRDIRITQMIVWTARKPYIDRNRPALVDFMEDTLRIVRWFVDPVITRRHRMPATSHGSRQTLTGCLPSRTLGPNRCPTRGAAACRHDARSWLARAAVDVSSSPTRHCRRGGAEAALAQIPEFGIRSGVGHARKRSGWTREGGEIEFELQQAHPETLPH